MKRFFLTVLLSAFAIGAALADETCQSKKDGAYMCEKEAMGQGIRAARNEKHP